MDIKKWINEKYIIVLNFIVTILSLLSIINYIFSILTAIISLIIIYLTYNSKEIKIINKFECLIKEKRNNKEFKEFFDRNDVKNAFNKVFITVSNLCGDIHLTNNDYIFNINVSECKFKGSGHLRKFNESSKLVMTEIKDFEIINIKLFEDFIIYCKEKVQNPNPEIEKERMKKIIKENNESNKWWRSSYN